MTGEDLDALEAKWSQQYDGHEVCELIAEVKRLREMLDQRPVLLIPSEDCAPRGILAELLEAEPDVEGHGV